MADQPHPRHPQRLAAEAELTGLKTGLQTAIRRLQADSEQVLGGLARHRLERRAPVARTEDLGGIGERGIFAEEVVRGDANSSSCAVYNFRDGRLVCVETLNRASEHMLARKLITQQIAVTPQQVADEPFDLKALVPKPAAPAATG